MKVPQYPMSLCSVVRTFAKGMQGWGALANGKFLRLPCLVVGVACCQRFVLRQANKRSSLIPVTGTRTRKAGRRSESRRSAGSDFFIEKTVVPLALSVVKDD